MSDNFSLLLASSVHDMKNSLGMLLSSLDELTSDMADMSETQRRQFAVLQGEASRIRNDLIYLLGLYRMQHNDLVVDVDEVFVDDFIDQQVAQNALLYNMRKLDVRVDCPAGLCGFFDEELVGGIINNILVNAARYTRTMVEIRAWQESGYLCIEIIDDGDGFPAAMLSHSAGMERDINFKTGSTHLGLHFAARIAAMHKSNDGRSGSISIRNLDAAGRGCFCLRLP